MQSFPGGQKEYERDIHHLITYSYTVREVDALHPFKAEKSDYFLEIGDVK